MADRSAMTPEISAIAHRLRGRFGGVHIDVIEDTVLDVYERLSSQARFTAYLPVLAERAAAARLERIVEDPDPVALER